jgi:Autotransporter beta-domain
MSQMYSTTSCAAILAVLLNSVGSTAAMAACMGSATGSSGPPSISATEVVTSQALDLLRKRRDEMLQPASFSGPIVPASVVVSAPPPGPLPPASAPAAPTVAAPAVAAVPQATASPATAQPKATAAKKSSASTTSASTPQAAPTAAKQSAQPKPQAIARSQTAPPPVRTQPMSHGAATDDTLASVTAARPAHASWAQVFGDRERETGLTYNGGTEGALRGYKTTIGFVGGVDWTVNRPSQAGQVVFGVLGGASQSDSRFNDINYLALDSTTGTTTLDRLDRTRARETVQGGGGGVYGVSITGSWIFDALARIDGYRLEQSDTVARFQPDGTGGFSECFQIKDRSGAVDFTSIVTAANASYRIALGPNAFFEPTAGIRYTYIDYGRVTGDVGLDVVDGSVFRLQAGGRYVTQRDLDSGSRAILTLTGLLYSDVSIDGLSAVNSLGFNPAAVNEGQIRALSQVGLSWAQPSGWTLSALGEVRGGKDLFGVGGKLTARYEW